MVKIGTMVDVVIDGLWWMLEFADEAMEGEETVNLQCRSLGWRLPVEKSYKRHCTVPL